MAEPMEGRPRLDGASATAAGAESGVTGAGPAFEKLMAVMNNKPTNREVLRRTLELCRTRRTVDEVEAVIQTYPEYPLVMQPPYRLIRFLVEGGGLVQIALGADGEPLTDEEKAGLSADEVDDLIVSFALETTDVGRAVADDLAPQVRLARLFACFPDRVPLYRVLLEFCRHPRTYADIEAHITKDDIAPLATRNYEPGIPMKPSVFVDNLESSGGLVWDNHRWNTTEEGARLLDAMDQQG